MTCFFKQSSTSTSSESKAVVASDLAFIMGIFFLHMHRNRHMKNTDKLARSCALINVKLCFD